MPQPRMSRFTPKMPVSAPPYGSSADGELCVSTFIAAFQPGTNSNMPALSENTESSHFFFLASLLVAPFMYVLKIESTTFFFLPIVSVIFALNILCLQCSDHVCARTSSSTSVGIGDNPAFLRSSATAGSR